MDIYIPASAGINKHRSLSGPLWERQAVAQPVGAVPLRVAGDAEPMTIAGTGRIF